MPDRSTLLITAMFDLIALAEKLLSHPHEHCRVASERGLELSPSKRNPAIAFAAIEGLFRLFMLAQKPLKRLPRYVQCGGGLHMRCVDLAKAAKRLQRARVGL